MVICLLSGLGIIFMESLLVSTGVVALAEIGDKTQLLAFILAARFKKPVPIILGILAATIVNHGLAGALGAWITSTISPVILRWVLGASFIGMAIWTMIPDEIEEEEAPTIYEGPLDAMIATQQKLHIVGNRNIVANAEPLFWQAPCVHIEAPIAAMAHVNF